MSEGEREREEDNVEEIMTDGRRETGGREREIESCIHTLFRRKV